MAVHGTAVFVTLACVLVAVSAQQCGRQAIQPVIPIRGSANDRIIGGTDARPHSWPWQAMYMHQRKGQNGHYFHCGATVVGRWWVLTAAHCCDLPPSMNVTGTSVVVGQHDQSNPNEPFKTRKEIAETIIHPSYNKPTPINNDICMLRMREPIEFNNHVTPICLPPNSNELPVGTKCWITGWGNTNNNNSQPAVIPNALQQVDVKVVKKSTCNAAYYGLVTSKMVCVQEEGKGSCNGDSGGPLQCKDSAGKWVLYGDTSFGSAQACVSKRHPSVYCSVAAELDWVRETMSKHPE